MQRYANVNEAAAAAAAAPSWRSLLAQVVEILIPHLDHGEFLLLMPPDVCN